MNDEVPDKPEPPEYEFPASKDEGAGGAKLFVIFFFAIVPLLGFAIVAMVIYSLLVR